MTALAELLPLTQIAERLLHSDTGHWAFARPSGGNRPTPASLATGLIDRSPEYRRSVDPMADRPYPG